LGKIILERKVADGVGGGKDFFEDEAVKRQIKEKTGFTPYPGSLNIRLTKESQEKRLKLQRDCEEHIHP
jgi:riboflavin kinase